MGRNPKAELLGRGPVEGEMDFSTLLSEGRFLKLAELRPPKGVLVDPVLEVAKRLHGRVDAIVIPDNPTAVVGLGGIALARRVVEAGHEVVLQIPCRDRNRIGLQSGLLSAYVEGVRSVVVTRGTDPAFGDHPRARAVYDLEPHELLAAIDGLAEGFDMSGSPIEGRPRLFAGAEVNPWLEADALEAELEEARKRVVAGAKFLVTTPVHDAARFAPLAARLAALGVPVLCRTVLVKSVGMARYLNANVAGVRVPEETIRRLRKAPDKTTESLRIAADLAEALKGVCRGVIFVPLGWEDRLPALLDLL